MAQKRKRNERISYEYSRVPVVAILIIGWLFPEEQRMNARLVCLGLAFVIAGIAGVFYRSNKKK